MPIRQRGEAWQVDVSHMVDGKRKRVRKDCESEVEAKSEEQKILARVSQDDLVVEKSAPTNRLDTMQKLLDEVAELVWKKQKGAITTIPTAQLVVDVIGPNKHPSTVTTGVVDAVVKRFSKDGNSGATINRKLSGLSVLLEFGHSRGVIKTIPKIQRQKESKHRIRWYNAEEEAHILSHFSRFGQPEMVDYVMLLIDTGMRACEALELLFSDVPAETVILHQGETKNDEGRIHPPNEALQRDGRSTSKAIACRKQEVVLGHLLLQLGKSPVDQDA